MATALPLESRSDADEIAALVARSRAAQAEIANYTQAQVDRLIRGMVWAVANESTAEMIAQHTVDETQLGNYDGKYLKIFRKTRATLMDIIDDKSVGVIEEDPARNLIVGMMTPFAAKALMRASRSRRRNDRAPYRRGDPARQL